MRSIIILISTFFISLDCRRIKTRLETEAENNQKECYNRIYRDCTHDVDFTEEEIENARKYIQNKFLTETSIKPVKPACSKLYVRKDFKCLTHKERMDVINVFKQLYKNGVMDRFAKLHAKYWPTEHKSNEAALWHRWFSNEFEKEMRNISRNISLPYWESALEFAAPERSIIWDYFGHAGTNESDYCVTDGLFADPMFRSEASGVQCLKRQWNNNKTLPVFGPPEWDTAIGQLSYDSWFLLSILAINSHFKTHLSIGGYAGHMSIPIAPYDPLFYLFHEYQIGYQLIKWQLIRNKNLVPQNYNIGIKIDPDTNKTSKPNLEKDRLAYYNISIIESFQVGFGDLCWIHDQHIKPINRLIKNEKEEAPTAIKRMSPLIMKKYYPKFVSGNYTALSYSLPEVGNCNSNLKTRKCRSMPISQPFLYTPNGRRQMKSFLLDAHVNTAGVALVSETAYHKFMADMLSTHYCSPYV